MMMEQKILNALGGRQWQYGVIRPSDAEYQQEVADACKQNICGKYNTSWCCPPAIGTWQENREKHLQYKKMLVFSTKYDLEDQYDIEGMFDAGKTHNEITRDVHRKLKGEDVLVLGAGGCSLCEKCAYPEPCRHPEDLIPSVEGCGIFVTQLAKAAGIHYINGEATVTYFGAVLYND